MTVIDSIFWHQGLFLQPQHFQILDANIRKLFLTSVSYFEGYFWGVEQCEIDMDGMASEIIGLKSFGALFQDGSIVLLGENAKAESRNFSKEWSDREKPFTVYIGLKKEESKNNATVVASGEDLKEVKSRYMTDQKPSSHTDIYLEAPVANIKKLTYALKIFFENEDKKSEGYILLPLCRLSIKKGAIALDDSFSYPTVNLHSSQNLKKVFDEIKESLLSRAKQLQEFKSPKSLKEGMDTNYFFYMFALQTVNRYAPLLRLEGQKSRVHPFALYKIIVQLVGELSMFTDRVDMLGRTKAGAELLGEYKHDEPFVSFASAKLLILELLDSLVIGPEYMAPFLRDGSIFTCSMENSMFKPKSSYFLVVKCGDVCKKAVEDFASVNKIAPRESINTLIQRALPGIVCSEVLTPPQGLPKREGILYLKLDVTNNIWLDVKRYNNIAIYYDDAPEDMTIHLAVVKGVE